MSTVDLSFLAPLPFPGLFFHIYQQRSYEEDEESASHLPLVRHLKEFQRRADGLDVAVSKYNKKILQCVEVIKKDVNDDEEDPESKRLAHKLVNTNTKIFDYLEGLLPLLREQKESAKQLENYLCPPTVELFHRKAEMILKNAPAQIVPPTKKNTCAICMESQANCIITIRCDTPSHTSSSSSRSRVRCEKDTCKCGPTMCKECLLTHYWTSTNKGVKSYAKCVCCRAEFCLKDVSPIEYSSDTTVAPTSAATTTSISEKAGREERNPHSGRKKGEVESLKNSSSSLHEKEAKESPSSGRRNSRRSRSASMANDVSPTDDTQEEEVDNSRRSTKRRRVNETVAPTSTHEHKDKDAEAETDTYSQGEKAPRYPLRNAGRKH